MNKKEHSGKNSGKIFADFTNQYSLSKTLRFELKPEGKTLENMRTHLEYDKDLQTFMKDQDIEDAYQTLKPAIDKIHEVFITKSLESKEAKEIDFAEYFEKYKKQEDDKGEKELMKEIGNLYEIGEKSIKNNYKVGWKWNKKEDQINKDFKLDWNVGGKRKKKS